MRMRVYCSLNCCARVQNYCVHTIVSTHTAHSIALNAYYRKQKMQNSRRERLHSKKNKTNKYAGARSRSSCLTLTFPLINVYITFSQAKIAADARVRVLLNNIAKLNELARKKALATGEVRSLTNTTSRCTRSRTDFITRHRQRTRARVQRLSHLTRCRSWFR